MFTSNLPWWHMNFNRLAPFILGRYFYGHHPRLCNCPVSSWPFATGGISVEISATNTVPPRGVFISQVEISATTCCLHEARRFHSYHTFYGHHPGLCNYPVSSWPFATGCISVGISATTSLLPRGVCTHITLFTGTTQDCAAALLVVGPSPLGVSQWRYRLQLRCLHEAFALIIIAHFLRAPPRTVQLPC